MAAIVQAEKVAIRYGARTVIEGVSATVTSGRRVAIIGPNGSGKSSLLRVLAGIQPPSAGRIYQAGRAALVAPTGDPPGDLTPFDLAAYGCGSQRKFWQWSLPADDAARVRDSLKRCELDERAQEPVATLSAGEVQRAWIAAALASAADVVMVDEPTTHLDLRFALSVLDTLSSLARSGVGVVAAIHDLTLAARFADEVWLVSDGCVHSGPPEEILERRALTTAFGVSVSTHRHPQSGYLVCLPDGRARQSRSGACT